MTLKYFFALFTIAIISSLSYQDVYSEISEDTICQNGQVLVLRDNSKYACVFDTTATTWGERGLSTVVEMFDKAIRNFDDCIAAGYPVMESQPRQCKTPDGQTHVEEVTMDKKESVSTTITIIPFGAETAEDDIPLEIPTSDLAQQVTNQLDLLSFKITHIQELAKNADIINYVIESNKSFETMQDSNKYIDQKDQEWVSTPKNTISPFMATVIDNKISDILRKNSVIPTEEFGNVLFPEIIITNSFGASIASSIRTEDYKQSDEIWWISSKTQSVQIRDVKWDESAKIYSADIVVRIVDSQGKSIGVLKAVTPFR